MIFVWEKHLLPLVKNAQKERLKALIPVFRFEPPTGANKALELLRKHLILPIS